jgi:hypothetical protein
LVPFVSGGGPVAQIVAVPHPWNRRSIRLRRLRRGDRGLSRLERLTVPGHKTSAFPPGLLSDASDPPPVGTRPRLLQRLCDTPPSGRAITYTPGC